MNKNYEPDWQLKKEKLTERGKYLLQTGLWSDCKFLVGVVPNQQELTAHKIFLTMASPVFEVMFHGEMAEKNIITVDDIQPDAFKAMLLYVYTDIVDLQSFDQACELCYVAKKYMMSHLVQICTEYIWRDLNEENACIAYEFGRLIDESILMDKSMVIIRSEAKHILEDPKFTDVELTTLLAILDQDNLNIDSEVQLFTAVHVWAASECQRKDLIDDTDALRSVALPAIYKIRFLAMKPAEFSEGPAKSKLLKQSEAFAILMNLCSSDNENYPMPAGFSMSKKLRYKTLIEHSIENCHPNYCKRPIIQQLIINNSGKKTITCESSLTFTVNKDVVLLGIQVHSQVLMKLPTDFYRKWIDDHPSELLAFLQNHPSELLNRTFHGHAEEISQRKQRGSQQEKTVNSFYRESLFAQLLDDDGTCITFCHFQKSVQYNTLLDVHFNVPYKVTKNKTYKVSIGLHKKGQYPRGKYVNCCNECMPVTFTFINQHKQSDCYIHSIIFNA